MKIIRKREHFKKKANLKRTGKAGIFAGSLELVKEGKLTTERLEEINQKVLLSKSNLKRSKNKLSLTKKTSLGTILETLNPPNIPIPSP